MNQNFQRIAIVNRGESALRFIYAVREFNQEHNDRLRTVALFSEMDRHAAFVREADESVLISGIATPHDRSALAAYGAVESIGEALSEVAAEAVWVGCGFVAEHAELADLCRDRGIVFIGPDPDSLRKLADPIAVRTLAEDLGIPVAPWSRGLVNSLSDALLQAERLGYPLLIRPVSGHEARPVHVVASASQLNAEFESARNHAFELSGNPSVFLERPSEQVRHVDVDLIGDHHGTTWPLGVRDCTVQLKGRSVLSEAPCSVLTPLQDQFVRDASVRLCAAVGYRSLGTMHFLYQARTQQITFAGANSQARVDHSVTECTINRDLIKLQIQVAKGERLQGDPPATQGHAIAIHLNAEDASGGSAHELATIERLSLLPTPGLRVDTGLMEGDTISEELESSIATITSHGHTRSEALTRLVQGIKNSVVVVKGCDTNRAALLNLLKQAELQANNIDNEWFSHFISLPMVSSSECAAVALIAAAIESYEEEFGEEKKHFYASAGRGRPQVRTGLSRTAALRYEERSYALRVHCIDSHCLLVQVDADQIQVRVEHKARYEYWLTINSRCFRIFSVSEEGKYRIEVDGTTYRIGRDDGGVIHAIAPAVVVSVAVNEGDIVRAGDTVAILEAMKMEMDVTAPIPGRVRRVFTLPNAQVDAGAPLIQLDDVVDNAIAYRGEPIRFGPLVEKNRVATPRVSTCRENLNALRQCVLGFDVDALSTTQRLVNWIRTCPAHTDDIRQLEDEILNVFLDISALFQHRPQLGESGSEEAPSLETCMFAYLRTPEGRGEGLPKVFVESLQRVLTHYGVTSLERSPLLDESLLRICKSHQRLDRLAPAILELLKKRLRNVPNETSKNAAQRALLERAISIASESFPPISEMAREVLYHCFDKPQLDKATRRVYALMEDHLLHLEANPNAPDRDARIRELIDCPQPLVSLFAARFGASSAAMRLLLLEVLTWRYYRIRTLMNFRSLELNGQCCVSAEYDHEGKRVHVITAYAEYPSIVQSARELLPLLEEVPSEHDIVIDLYVSYSGPLGAPDTTEAEVRAMLQEVGFVRKIRRIVVVIGSMGQSGPCGRMEHFTYRPAERGYEEEQLYRGIHPMIAKRLHLWRLGNFNIKRLPSPQDVYVIHGVARNNSKDERLFVCAEVRDLTPVRDDSGRIIHPQLEHMFSEALAAIRQFQSNRKPQERLYWNRILLYVWPPFSLTSAELNDLVHKLAPYAEGLGLEQVIVRARIPNPQNGELRDMVVRISSPGGRGFLITFRPPGLLQPLRPLTDYEQKVVRMRQRGLIYPYEIVKIMTSGSCDPQAELPPGTFIEHDLDSNGTLTPVDRPYGENKANIIAGVIRNFTSAYPEGMVRVVLMGDPCKDLGALAEPECRRIIAALDLAKHLGVPLEWFAISAGARISMESGVENMDWIARVLRRLVEFTQAGGEVNLIINGINVGAQPYWNAEATMLMHTRGILIMTSKAAMVLTGKRALDYSGSISAEDNFGIGGYDRIMGHNGQAQYWARDIDEACHILFRHYDHSYVAPGERFPRRVLTNDPSDRDVQLSPHNPGANSGFTHVGEIFSDETNRARKKAFDIRSVMMATIDQDRPPLERWAGMRGAETAVVWDAHLGGFPMCLIGIESKPVPRLGFISADGPQQWCAGTLFPLSSKKVARAINAASNNRPVVVLANLSGFDGSPESMRNLQLEYGAEIGRAVVNFKGPMVFCVISRYHGGAYVVFSRALNEDLQVLALEGTYASVIGGAPAAAVVFAGEVDARARKDPRLQALGQAMALAEPQEKARLKAQWDELFARVHSEKLGEVADEFDHVHSVHRALKVGALNDIIPPPTLRPHLIRTLEAATRTEEKSETLAPEESKVEEFAA